jgi:hypothetical protein
MTEITAPSPIRQAVEQLRSINTKTHASVMAVQRDGLEIQRTDMSIAISNLNSEIEGMESMMKELANAIAIKKRLRSEHVSTFEAIIQTLANLDIQGKRMEAGV